jgi:hypothetical protein
VLLPLLCLECFPSTGAASLIFSLETQLAGSVPASKIGRLNQDHDGRIKGLQAQKDRARELEAELAKAKEAESTLSLEFEQRLSKEK